MPETNQAKAVRWPRPAADRISPATLRCAAVEALPAEALVKNRQATRGNAPPVARHKAVKLPAGRLPRRADRDPQADKAVPPSQFAERKSDKQATETGLPRTVRQPDRQRAINPLRPGGASRDRKADKADRVRPAERKALHRRALPRLVGRRVAVRPRAGRPAGRDPRADKVVRPARRVSGRRAVGNRLSRMTRWADPAVGRAGRAMPGQAAERLRAEGPPGDRHKVVGLRAR